MPICYPNRDPARNRRWGQPEEALYGLPLSILDARRYSLGTIFSQARTHRSQASAAHYRGQRESQFLSVAIDGPLNPDPQECNAYRTAERVLSRGMFQRRGKPGPTTVGSGPQLHRHATFLAKMVLRHCKVEAAKMPCAASSSGVYEAFPNRRRSTRLSNGFSQKFENHAAAVALSCFAYNFVHIHRTLRLIPAMAAGVAHRQWDVSHLVVLLETEERQAKKVA